MPTSHSQIYDKSNNCNDNEILMKRKTQRRPFTSLSSNTPSKKAGKRDESSTQPVKPLLRSSSAPVMPSPTPKVKPSQAQIAPGLRLSIFRSATSVSPEVEDLWTLKRASPIFDDEDDEEEFESPSKRSRTFFIPFPEERDAESSERQRLPWDCQIREDENGFTLLL